MREKRLGPEEELFKVNDISDSIYIVMKGKGTKEEILLKSRMHISDF